MPSASSMQRGVQPQPLDETPLVEGGQTSRYRVSDLLGINARLHEALRTLVTNHNALVDYVEQRMREQRARLGAAE